MAIEYITSQKEHQAYLENTLFVSYFTALWCGPCKAIAPKIAELYDTYKNVEVAKIDIDEALDVASAYNISSVPTFIFWHKKKETGRVQGANPKAIEDEFKKTSELAPDAERIGKGLSSGWEEDPFVKSRLPSSRHEVLNGRIDLAASEALNVIVEGAPDARSVLRAKDKGFVMSDADSQALFNVAFTSGVKVYSLLVKKAQAGDAPVRVRIWKNFTGGLLFSDVESEAEDQLSELEFKDGWAEVKLRFVKFQNVSTLGVVLEGEDYEIGIEKLVFIGME